MTMTIQIGKDQSIATVAQLIKLSVEKLAFRTSRLESKTVDLSTKVDSILEWMNEDFKAYVGKLHMVASVNAALDLADKAIMEVLNSITPLVQGKLTHNLLDPLQAQDLIDKTQDMVPNTTYK